MERDGCSRFQRQLESIKIDQQIRKEFEEHSMAAYKTLAADNARLRAHDVRSVVLALQMAALPEAAAA
jgi:hypothetical protein